MSLHSSNYWMGIGKVILLGRAVIIMLKKIYTELVLIRKELQAIRNSKESNTSTVFDEIDKNKEELAKVVRRSIHGIVSEDQWT